MPYGDLYERQVRLLIRSLPFVQAEPDFALKGGTAINLFVRNLPRLSVDIDLAYLPVHDRAASLAAIDTGLRRIAAAMAARLPDVSVTPGQARAEGVIDKLLVAGDGVQIKIEVTPVLRGTVFPPALRAVAPAVEDRFGFAEALMVSLPDLYAGKIMAALDRQHPRDLFDVRDLLAHEGVYDELRRAFAVYLISHSRSTAEVLRPRRKDITDEFQRGFAGMTEAPIALDALLAAREALIETMVDDMPQAHRDFLIGFKQGQPDWDLIGLPGVADLPAVRWKQQNLDRLAPERRERLVEGLRAVWAA
jgi:predicted nucleotidyltransferase component of viral defense system